MFNHSKAAMRTLAIILALMLSMAGLMSGCKKTQEAEADTTEDYEAILQAELEAEFPEEDPGVEMWNPYKPIYFPADLVDEIYPLLSEDGINYNYEFHATVDGKDALLFSIILGPDEVPAGYLLGQLDNTEHGSINVNLIMAQVYPEDWSEEGYNTICIYQERINDMIVQFYEDEGFTPSS